MIAIRYAFLFLSLTVALIQPAYAASSQQVVYIFDKNRALILTGSQCQGALYYIDKERKIQTLVTTVFRAVFFSYIHPSEKYIAVPYSDLSAIRVSRDYGRTFETARFSPAGGAEEFKSYYPVPEEVESFTVVNDQGFFLTKQNYIYVSSKPFGKRWGLDYMSLNAIPRFVYRDWDNFKDMPTSVPEVKDYKGWTHMKCDPTK